MKSILPLLPLFLPVVESTITLSTTGKQYHSRPASFGFNLEYGLQYVALLQVVEDDLHLCGGERDDAWDEDGTFQKQSRQGGWLGELADDDWGGIGSANPDPNSGDQMLRRMDSEMYEERVKQRREENYESSMQHNSWGQHRGLRAAIPSSFGRLRTVGTLPFGGKEEGIINILDVERAGREESWIDHVKGVKFEDSDPVNAGTLDGGDAKNGTTKKEIRVTPSHGVPVAILAKRGQCAYETKARVASRQTSPHGTVRFVIVYDNTARDGNHLITMMPKDDIDGNGEHGKHGHDLYKEVGLVFVSYESGVDLHEFINSQPRHVTAQGGPRILVDGSDHWVFPPMDESAAGLAFILMLFGCVCSLSLFLNTTFYGTGRGSDGSVADHHLFFLGPDGQITDRGVPNNGGNSRNRGRGNGLRLLTLDEVETLPTREYCAPTLPESQSLELRDKSDMPYPDEEGQQHNREGDSSLHDTEAAAAAASSQDYEDTCRDSPRGGLCEALLPSKKDDPYFDHNSCSICLDEYEVGEHIRVLPCQHTFHSDCIFPWLTERSPTCPLCKAMFEAVQYEEEEADEDEGREETAADGDVGDGEEEERSVHTEASAPSPSAASMPPPLEDEPPVHRRQRRREERQASRERRREERQASRRSRRERGESEEGDGAVPSGNGLEEQTADEVPEVSATEERPRQSSSGLRGRLWGLFGATSAGATGASADALEEPLLADGDGDDHAV